MTYSLRSALAFVSVTALAGAYACGGGTETPQTGQAAPTGSAVITADAIISTVTDAIILVLPLPLTWSLQLPPKKKMRVGSMLAVGGLATAFSAWRLHLILTDGRSPDATILFVQVVLSG